MDDEKVVISTGVSRDGLSPRERAVSDALDELNVRCHGMFSSWSYPIEFIEWLEERGYTVVKLEDDNAHQHS